MKKILKTLFVLMSIPLIVSCTYTKEEDGIQIYLDETLKNTETYIYEFDNYVEWTEGDGEKWDIKVQPKHYEINEIVRTKNTDTKFEYHYKPKAGYTGKDYVILTIDKKIPSEISMQSYTVKINFKVNK